MQSGRNIQPTDAPLTEQSSNEIPVKTDKNSSRLRPSFILDAICNNEEIIAGLIFLGAGFTFPGKWGWGSMAIGGLLITGSCFFKNCSRPSPSIPSSPESHYGSTYQSSP